MTITAFPYPTSRLSRFRGAGSKLACVVLAFLLFGLTGCSSTIEMMPTPNLYSNGDIDPFPQVPAEFQNNHVDVLYMTDRAVDATAGPNGNRYGYKRSRSLAFGVSRVQFGDNVSWADLVAASRTSNRKIGLPVTVASNTELVRFPPTPQSLIQIHPPPPEPVNGVAMLGDEEDPAEEAAEAVVKNEIEARLAKTQLKEVYLFIHGYNNSFEDSVETIAQLWHFFGRQGVPIAYSWPAGGAGLLRGYTYDQDSSEFTVFHLKRMIRLIASCPDVQKINIISHSRGTDTMVNALRELHMEIHGSGRNTREVLKLGTVVMAAPDIDVDVVIQKFVTVRLGQVPERFVMYINDNDKALSLSTWLFGGVERLGELNASLFTPEELEFMRKSKTTQIVNAHISIAGSFGHDYFHSNPGVSSDLIMVMRYHLPPGAETGRPLKIDPKGFWIVDDQYPGKETIGVLNSQGAK